MNLFSRNSIILYSLLGLVSLFLAGFIRNLLQFNTWLEVFITSCIIIPMYIFARKIFSKFLRIARISKIFRIQKEGETTPEYLNHINAQVNKVHEDLIKLSPFYKISKILKTSKPLSLNDIKDIFNEVKKHRSA